MGAAFFPYTALDGNGAPISGARMDFFIKDTTAPQNAFTDAALSVASANPQIANASGRLQAYLNDTLNYTVRIRNADNSATILEADYTAGEAQPFVITFATLDGYNALITTILNYLDDIETVAANDADISVNADNIASINTLADAIDDGSIGTIVAGLDAKVNIAGGNASATVVTATGSTTARALSEWTARVETVDEDTGRLNLQTYTIPSDIGGGAPRVGTQYVRVNSETSKSSGATRLSYAKTAAFTEGGNEIGRTLIGRWADVQGGQMWLDWTVAQSPLNPSSGLTGAPTEAQLFGMIMGECNPQNRYADQGYATERRLQTPFVGGHQMIPETQDFSGLLGSNRIGYHILFTFQFGRSPFTCTANDRHARTYNALLLEPNGIAPNGRFISAAGARSFITAISIDDGGTGYVAGDVGETVTLTSGAGRDAEVEIVSVSGGAVTEVRLANAGSFTTNPDNPAATSSSGVSGSGLTLTLTFSDAAEDPNAVAEVLNIWKTAIDTRDATFRDATLGDNHAMRLKNGQGVAYEDSGATGVYRVFGTLTGNETFVNALSNAQGILFQRRNGGAVAGKIDTSVDSPTGYVTNKAGVGRADVLAEGSATDIDLYLTPKGAGQIKSAAATQWAPTFSSSVGTLGTITLASGGARYERIGAKVEFTLNFTVTDNGTGSGVFRFTLPETALVGGSCVAVNASTGRPLAGRWPAASNLVSLYRSDAAYPVTTGDVVSVTGHYFVA